MHHLAHQSENTLDSISVINDLNAEFVLELCNAWLCMPDIYHRQFYEMPVHINSFI